MAKACTPPQNHPLLKISGLLRLAAKATCSYTSIELYVTGYKILVGEEFELDNCPFLPRDFSRQTGEGVGLAYSSRTYPYGDVNKIGSTLERHCCCDFLELSFKGTTAEQQCHTHWPTNARSCESKHATLATPQFYTLVVTISVSAVLRPSAPAALHARRQRVKKKQQQAPSSSASKSAV